MAVVPRSGTTAAFALRSAALTLVSVVLKTTDLARLGADLEERIGATPELFDNDPVAIDLTPVRDTAEAIDFAALVALLRQHRMLPIAAKGGSAQQMADALAAGLPHARRARLAGAGHFVMLEQPDEVASLLASFLAELGHSEAGQRLAQ